MQAHSILAASASHRWMNCPGSVRMTRDIPSTTSPYAEEGSAAHYLAEQCLRKGKTASDFDGRVLRRVDGGFSILKAGAVAGDGDWVVTDEMVEAVQEYLDTVHRYHQAIPNAVLEVEKRFDLSEIYPGMFGTNDACLLEPFGELIVFDLKYGKGVPVEVDRNPQLLYYALGAYLGQDVENVTMVIVQPRARHKDGPVREFSISAVDLLAWAKDELLPAAKATGAPDAALQAGEWCKFCGALAVCPAVRDHAMEVAKSDFQMIELPAPEALSMLDLVRVLQSAGLLSDWLRAVEAHAQDLLLQGQVVPGFKLVEKRTIRRWSDEAQVASRLERYKDVIHLYERKMRGPAPIEKEVKKHGITVDLTDLIDKPEGGLTIAPESDRRPAVEPGANLFLPADTDADFM